MSLALLWFQLVGAAVIILFASKFLARAADVIAFKTGLGRSFAGVVLLATATSLPELGTGVSSVTLVGAPDLAVGAAFGSNLFNLLIIALLDIAWRNGPILNSVSTTSVLVGGFGIAIITLAALAVIYHGTTTTMSAWYISPFSVALLLVFFWAMYMIYRSGKTTQADASEHTADISYTDDSLVRTIAIYIAAAAVVVGTAIWLAQIGDRIGVKMGWEASFVGTQFLALITSLPELATSFAALRLNAPALAISNVLGSNLFNMSFVLFLDDVAFTQGALWAAISGIHTLTAVIAVVMTAVVIAGLVIRPRRRPGKFWTVESALLIGLYVVGSILVFTLG